MKQAKKSTQLDRAIELMLLGQTDASISSQLNVSRTTVWRWRNSEEAVALLSAHRNRVLERISDRVSSMADKAIDVVESVLCDPEAGSMLKMKAAAMVLDRAGITERNAIEMHKDNRRSETERAKYLDRLEDPMDPLHLLQGFGA